MQFIAVSTNTRDVSSLLEAEGAQIARLQEAGTVRDVWLKADLSGAVLLLEGADEAAVQAQLDTLPLVQAQATTVSMIPVVGMPAPTG